MLTLSFSVLTQSGMRVFEAVRFVGPALFMRRVI